MTSVGAGLAEERFSLSVVPGGVDEEWDTFLQGTPGGHHVQSSRWAAVKALNGWRATRVVVRESGRLVGGGQILSRPVSRLGRVGYVPKGPVVSVEDEALADLVLAKIKAVATADGIGFLLAQPSAYGVVSTRLANNGFMPFPVETAPSATVTIDLSQDLDEILAGMSKGMRNGVRRSQRRGIVAREGQREDLPAFHRLLEATSARQGMSIFALDYFQGMWDILEPAGHAKLFLSEYEGEPVSAQLCVTFGDTVVAKQIGWSGEHGKLHPNEALDWHTIGWARERGYRYYDLEGIERDAARSLIEGGTLPEVFMNTPTSYKVRLGGQARLYPGAYCFVANGAMRLAYRAVGRRMLEWTFVRNAVGRFRTR